MARSSVLSTLLTVAAMALLVRMAFTPQQPQETFVVGSTALRGVARAELRWPRFARNDSGASRESPSVRSEKLQNESSPNFPNYCPEFCSEFCEVLCFISWETETGKKFTKNSRSSSMQNSQAILKSKCFLDSGQSNLPFGWT